VHLVELSYSYPETILTYFKQQGTKISLILKENEVIDEEVMATIYDKTFALMLTYAKVLYCFSPALHPLLIDLSS